MARSKSGKAQTAKTATAYKKSGRTVLLGAAGTVLLAGGLSIVSISLGFLALGLCSLGMFSFVERGLRRKWETAYSFKIKDLEKSGKALAEQLEEHDRDLSFLKARVHAMAAKAKKPEAEAAPTVNTAGARGGERPVFASGDVLHDALAESPALRDAPRKVNAPKPLSVKRPAARSPAGDPGRNYLSAHLKHPRKAAPGVRKFESFFADGPSHRPRPLTRPQSPPASANDAGPPPAAGAMYDDQAVFSDAIIQELLQDTVLRGDIEVFRQPVVRLPENQVRYVELFTRLKVNPGVYVPAEQYLKLARAQKLQQDLDCLLLARCLFMLKNSPNPEGITPLCLNVEPKMFGHDRFMRALLGFAAERRSLMGKLNFEMSFSSFKTLSPSLLKVVRGLGVLGCNFTLDHISGPVDEKDFDLEMLMDHKVRLVKFHQRLFLDHANPHSFRALMRLKNRLEGNGIGVVAEKIEDEAAMRALERLSIHYAQGYLFGAPRPAAEAVSAPAARYYRKRAASGD